MSQYLSNDAYETGIYFTCSERNPITREASEDGVEEKIA